MNEVLDDAAQDGPEDILDLSIGPPDYNCCRSAPNVGFFWCPFHSTWNLQVLMVQSLFIIERSRMSSGPS